MKRTISTDDAPVGDQTRQCLENVESILASEEMNEVYGECFGDSRPARSAIEVGSVPKGAALEIEAIAAAE